MQYAQAAAGAGHLSSGPHRRIAWIAVVAALLTALAPVLWLRARAEGVAVLIIEENNSQILAGPLREPPEPRLILRPSAGPNQPQGLLVHSSDLLPKRGTRIYVYQAIYSGLDLVEDRLWQSSSLPETVSVGSPVGNAGTTLSGPGKGAEPPGGVQVREALRQVPGDITIRQVDRDGRLTLMIRGREVTLAPDGVWVEGRVRREGTEEVLGAENWDAEAAAALQRGDPVTVLRIHYLGRHPLGWFQSE